MFLVFFLPVVYVSLSVACVYRNAVFVFVLSSYDMGVKRAEDGAGHEVPIGT